MIKMHSTIYYIVVILFPIVKTETVSEKKCEEYELLRAKLSDHHGHHGDVDRVSSRREFPHIVLLGYGDLDDVAWNCGGALISDRFVLTTAHCVKNRELGRVSYVMLGTINSDYPREIVDVSETMTPSTYRAPSRYNDIALVKLDSEVDFTTHVFPACLNTEFRIDPDTLSAVKFESNRYESFRRNKLIKMDMTLYSASSCKRTYAAESRLQLSRGISNDIQVCAGAGSRNERVSCKEDRAGVLQIKEGNLYYIVGLHSFGKGCEQPNTPDVFTRVSAYIPWIERNAWPK